MHDKKNRSRIGASNAQNHSATALAQAFARATPAQRNAALSRCIAGFSRRALVETHGAPPPPDS